MTNYPIYELHREAESDTFFFREQQTQERFEVISALDYGDDKLVLVPRIKDVLQHIEIRESPLPLGIKSYDHIRNKNGLINKTGIDDLDAYIYSQWAVAQQVKRGFKHSQRGYAEIYDIAIQSGSFCADDMFELFSDFGFVWREHTAMGILYEYGIIEKDEVLDSERASELAVKALDDSEYASYDMSYEVDGKELILYSLNTDAVPEN
ncbi:MAG: hypothetical protein ACTIJH_11890 [Moraxellaceae bacterium]